MTDRIKYLTVILDEPYADDELDDLCTAIRLLRGIRSVVLGKPVNLDYYLAVDEAKMELRQKLIKVVLSEEPK